jgi:hypothetical protein
MTAEMKTPVSKKGNAKKSTASSSKKQKAQDKFDFDTDEDQDELPTPTPKKKNHGDDFDEDSEDQSELPTPTPKKSVNKKKEKKREKKAKQKNECTGEPDVMTEDEPCSKKTEKKQRKDGVEQPVVVAKTERKSEKKSERKHKKKETVVDADPVVGEVEQEVTAPQKEKKSGKKSKKKEPVVEEPLVEDMEQDKSAETAIVKKRKHEETDAGNDKTTKPSRSNERKELLALVPKVDADGISYTKLQLRRMVKRVKKGLPPIPTAHEEQERLKQERQMQMEDELEFADMLYDKSDVTGRNDEELDEEDDDEEDNDEEETPQEFTAPEEPFVPSKKNPQPPSKKTKRSKPVPPDYTCMACNTKSEHWIYDCPNKITKRGTNLVAKKLRGIHHPDARKVFVSGLPFEMKKQDVEGLFKGCGSIAQCKLVTFPDTGRCKGQAFISFDTDEGAKQALKLSGQILQNEPAPKPKKGKREVPEPSRKDLKLRVTKVLNRIQTKGSGGT